MRRLWIVCLLAWQFLALRALAGELDQFNVGGWVGVAYSDEAGKFVYCSVSAGYGNGAELNFVITSQFDFQAAFANPAWHFEKGSAHPVQLSFDNKPAIAAAGYAYSAQGLGIVSSDRHAFFDQFHDSKSVRLDVDNGGVSFDLTGLGTALIADAQCAQKWSAAQNGTPAPNPFIKQEAAEASEGTEIMSKLLSLAKISGYTIFDAEEVQRMGRHDDAIWQKDRVLGTLKILPKAQQNKIDTYFEPLVASDKSACSPGEFTATKHNGDQDTHTPLLAKLTTICDHSDNNIIVYYFFVSRARGGLYLLSVSSSVKEANDATVGSLNDKILAAIQLLPTGTNPSVQ